MRSRFRVVRVNQSYFSAASLNSRGIIPNNVYNRYNFTFRNTTQLIKDKLTLDLGASMRQYKRNPLVQGLYHNPLIPIYLFSRAATTSQVRGLRALRRHGGLYKVLAWSSSPASRTPGGLPTASCFSLSPAHRYTFNATLRKWDIADWIPHGRVRTDNMVMNYTRKIYASSDKLFASEYGNYQNNKIHHNNLYADALLSINKRVSSTASSLVVQPVFAASSMTKNDGGFGATWPPSPTKFSVYNVDMSHSQTKPYADRYHDQTQAVYATAQLGI